MIYDDDELEDFDDLEDMEQEPIICPHCGGTGSHPYLPRFCSFCGGTGEITADGCFDDSYKRHVYRATRECFETI